MRNRHVFFAMTMLVVALSGCNDLSGLTGKQALPSGIPDPSVYRNQAGAVALYQTAVAAFQFSYGDTVTGLDNGQQGHTQVGSFAQFMLASGLLTDELAAGDLGGCQSSSFSCALGLDSVDARHIPGDSYFSTLYNSLQGARNAASLGVGALAAYAPAVSPALRGHLHALIGYTDLLLADLYCSGVPLSTLNFNGTTAFTYAASSTTTQVYLAALAQFDTAIALSGDSIGILNLARVGKGRTWLQLGQFDSAEAAVVNVPDNFSYQFLVDWTGGGPVGNSLFYSSSGSGFTMVDREGLTGLPYLSGDPRTAAELFTTNNYGQPVYLPVKYGGATPAIAPITVADWIEGRLIRAEAALHAGDVTDWLSQLNDLRSTAMVQGQTGPLSQLTDPGLGLSSADADTARVNLLFRERAYWLFLTGHRQGDLHRLIRQYHRLPNQVYPTGSYSAVQIGSYGGDVDLSIPDEEQDNPKFHGCLSRGAV